MFSYLGWKCILFDHHYVARVRDSLHDIAKDFGSGNASLQ